MVVFPGGFGTFDELFELLTWNNLGIPDKKVYLLNINGYYDALIQLLENMDQQGFMYDSWKTRLIAFDSVSSFMNALT